MLIADSQVHIWAPDTPDRPWFRKPITHRDEPLTADRLLADMDAAGVDRAVLVPPGFDGPRNDLILDAARRYPDRFAAMGRLETDKPEARERLAAWLEQPGMYGVRFSFNRALGPALSDGRMEWVWSEAEKAGIPVMMLVPHTLMPLIDRVAADHPGLKIALCHLGLPTEEQDEAAFRDFDMLLPLAKRPNVSVKASALPTYTTASYPFAPVHPYLRRVFDAFGPKRVFWGTDYSRLLCPYREAITLFTEELPWLSGEDKEWVMGRALCEWLGWDTPAAAH